MRITYHPPISYAYVVQYNDYDRVWEVSDDYEGEVYSQNLFKADAVALGIEQARRAHTLLYVQTELGTVERTYDFRPFRRHRA